MAPDRMQDGLRAAFGALRSRAAAAWCGAAFAFVLVVSAYSFGRDHDAACVSSLWLVNAGMLAATLRADPRLRPWLLLAGFSATLIAGIGKGLPPADVAMLATINLAEVGIASTLLARLNLPQGDFRSIRDLAFFFGIAGLLAPLISGILRLLALWIQQEPDYWWISLNQSLADALGMIILVPLLLTMDPNTWSTAAQRRALLETAPILLLATGVTYAIFWQSRFPLLFLVLPVLTIAAFRLRFAGTAFVIAIVAAIATWKTLAGSGPIANLLSLDQPGQILFLEAFLAVTVMATLPVASILADRRRLADKLSDSERRFRQLALAAPISMFRTDGDGQLSFANTAWTTLTGQDPAATAEIGSAGSSWLATIADHARPAAAAKWQRARFEGSALSIDVPQTRPGGTTGWTNLTLSPERDDEGRIAGWIGIAHDIDERTRAAEKLVESEHLHRLLAEHSNDIIARLSFDGRRLYVSPATFRILGYHPDELIGKTPMPDIHPEDRARVERVVRSLLSGEEDPVCSYRHRHKDGHYVWLEAAYRLVRDETTGAPVEFIASVRDIGIRREAEMAVAATAARLEESHRLLTMAEALGKVGHWRLDARTQQMFWSDELYRMLDHDPADRSQMADWFGAYHPDDRDSLERHIRQCLVDGQSWHHRGRLVRPDGATRHVQSSGQCERAPDGTITGVFGVAHDITDRIAAETALIAARDEARAAADAKAAFLATMSHEIRTPMTGVLGMIELLRTDPAPDDRERFFDSLEQSANLLMTVLDDILDFSKIEGRELTLEDVDFDLAELARATLALFHNAASRKGLLLTLACPVGALPVRGDPVRLQQILCNLVSNAIKFTHSGHVELRIAVTSANANGAERRRIRCQVIDSGIGVSDNDIGRLFQPFAQADASTTRRFGGTGLGLAISKRLVEAMGGRIGVDSVPDAGSTFWFEVELDAGARREQPRRLPQQPHSRCLSVLVAEDNQVNQALISALVRRDGHIVTCVDNGRLAVEAAAERHFDLILMDIQMPEMDGIAATRAIRSGGGPCATIPILALTADASIERRRLYDDVGLDEFLTKPIDARLLSDRMAAVAAREPNAVPPPAPLPEPKMTSPIFDEQLLASLQRAIGQEHLDRLMGMLHHEVSTRPVVIADLIAADQLVAAAAEAHSLKGASSGVGARRLADAAAAIEAAPDTGDDPAPLANALRAAASDTLAALAERQKA